MPKKDESKRKTEIKDSRGFVIGDFATVINNFFNEKVLKRFGLEQRAGFIILFLTIIGVGAILYFGLRTKPKSEMTGDFNIAVAEFLVVDEDGNSLDTGEGKILAEWLYSKLMRKKKPDQEIWPPNYTKRIEGKTFYERGQNANELALRIKANIIIYGVIKKTTDKLFISPEFSVQYRGFEEGEEILGAHALGSEFGITVEGGSFDKTYFEGVDNNVLLARSRALQLITSGLGYYKKDNFEKAIEHFEKAEEEKGWMGDTGKEVVYLLLGNTYLRLAAIEKDTRPVMQALEYYQKDTNKNYARAKIGEANALYLLALGDPSRYLDSSPVIDSIDSNLLIDAQNAYGKALSLANQNEQTEIQTKVDFGMGQISLAHYALQKDAEWLDHAENQFLNVIAAFDGSSLRLKSTASHAYGFLGLIEVQHCRFSDALAWYQLATDLASSYWRGEYTARMAELYLTLGQSQDAEKQYTEAMMIAEENTDSESYERYAAAKYSIGSNENISACTPDYLSEDANAMEPSNTPLVDDVQGTNIQELDSSETKLVFNFLYQIWLATGGAQPHTCDDMYSIEENTPPPSTASIYSVGGWGDLADYHYLCLFNLPIQDDITLEIFTPFGDFAGEADLIIEPFLFDWETLNAKVYIIRDDNVCSSIGFGYFEENHSFFQLYIHLPPPTIAGDWRVHAHSENISVEGLLHVEGQTSSTSQIAFDPFDTRPDETYQMTETCPGTRWNEAVETITVGNTPHDLAWDGTNMWVANQGDNTIMRIDIDTLEVVSTIPVGKSPDNLLWDGKHLWVSNAEDGNLLMVDPETSKIMDTITIGDLPSKMVWDGTMVWVISRGDNRILSIDPETGSILSSILVEPTPKWLNWDGKDLWVLSMNSESLANSYNLQQIDNDFGEAVQNITYYDPFLAMLKDRSGSELWINASDQEIIGQVVLSSDEVEKLHWVYPPEIFKCSPWETGELNAAAWDGTYYWKSSCNGIWSFVELIDPLEQTEIKRNWVQVRNRPSVLEWGGGYLWVTNSQEGTIQRINTRTIKP
jgi:YVTN family beta-propeller protein